MFCVGEAVIALGQRVLSDIRAATAESKSIKVLGPYSTFLTC